MYTYTFDRIADVPVDHTGFWGLVMLCVIIILLVMCADREDLVKSLLLMSVPVGIAYWISFHANSQEPQVFPNVPVTAELVGFQPEGYRERVGKSQQVDRHVMYVVYSVDGNQVILQADTGVEYPQRVVLYRN